MIDYLKIAREFAAKQRCDIIQPSAECNGYKYFRLDFTGRPRYTGLPYIIKISPSGKVQQVVDFDEIFWANDRRTITGEQSV